MREVPAMRVANLSTNYRTNTDLRLSISRFRNRLDNRPERCELGWHEFKTELLHHPERLIKDGPAFSFAVYREGATRGNEGVEELTGYAAGQGRCLGT